MNNGALSAVRPDNTGYGMAITQRMAAFWLIHLAREQMKPAGSYWRYWLPLLSVCLPAMTGAVIAEKFRRISIWRERFLLNVLNAIIWHCVPASNDWLARQFVFRALSNSTKRSSGLHWKIHVQLIGGTAHNFFFYEWCIYRLIFRFINGVAQPLLS